jgi:hypothetical protein
MADLNDYAIIPMPFEALIRVHLQRGDEGFLRDLDGATAASIARPERSIQLGA